MFIATHQHRTLEEYSVVPAIQGHEGSVVRLLWASAGPAVLLHMSLLRGHLLLHPPVEARASPQAYNHSFARVRVAALNSGALSISLDAALIDFTMF